MKSNKKIKKISNLPMLIPLGLTIPLFSAACDDKSNNKNNNDQNQKNNQSQKPINGQVNYLAIGDDYAIGHNNTENSKNNNWFNKEKNEVYGVSYASYLANAILLVNDQKTNLATYENYGIANSKIKDWLFLLNNAKYSNQKQSFEQIQQLNKDLSLINTDLTSEKLVQAIQKANLLTISIGFNDIFKKHEILGLIFNQDEKIQERIEDFKNKINQRIDNLKTYYANLIDEIKQINQEINISLTGFLSPLLHTINLQGNNELNEVLKVATKKLNDTIISVAEQKNLNFYSFENKDYIWQNNSNFTTDFLSIYPNKNAYKKLGQDIFAKMSMTNDDYNKLFNNQEKSNHVNALEFEKQATTVKSLIFGINDSKTDSYNKEYPFEKNQINKEIITSEKQNSLNEALLKELKLNLNNSKNDEIKNIISNLLSILGITKKEVYQTFLDLCDSLIQKNEIDLLKTFFNKILDSKMTKDTLNKANIAILELLAKQSDTNTSFANIKKLINDQWLKNNNFYFLIKEILDKKYLENKENKEFLANNLANFIKAMFKDEILNKIFPSSLKKLILQKVSIEKQLDAVMQKISINLLDQKNQEKYFKFDKFEDFIKEVLIDTKEEIIVLFAESIKQIKNNKNTFDNTINEIGNELKNVYQIKNERIDAIKYFLSNFIENLDFNQNNKNQLSYQLLDQFAKTILTNLDKNVKINRKFFESLALDNKNAINKNNKLFFELISHIPNKTGLEKDKYNNGMIYLAASLVKIDKFLDPKEISDLNKNKDSLFAFIKNLSEAEGKGSLNKEGKRNLEGFISLAIDDGLDNGLIKSLLDKFGNYVIVSPLTNYIKNNNLEDEILKLNPEKNVKEVITNWFKGIYDSITNKDVVEKIKKLAYDIIFDNGKKYNKENPEKFIISILKNIDKNGLTEIINELFKQLTTNEKNFSLIADIFVMTLDSKLKIKLDVNEKNEIAKDINNLIKNIPGSELLKTIKNEIIEIIKSIEKEKVNNFSDLQKELTNKFSASIGKIINQKNIGQLFDLLLIENNKNKENNQPKINIILKWTKLILSKINNSNKDHIKELISEFLSNSTIKSFLEKQINRIEEIILKEDSNAKQFAKKTIEKINKIIFNNDENNFVDLSLDWILGIKEEELKNINNWSDFISKIISSKSKEISSSIKPIIKELTNDRAYLKDLFSFSIKAVGKKYKFSYEGTEIENIANFLARSISNLNDDGTLSNTISDFLKNLIENISSKEIKIEEIKENIISSLKQIDYEKLFTEDFFKKAALAVFDKSVKKDEFEKELQSLYNFLSENLPKLKNSAVRRKRNTSENKENNNFLRKLESIIINALKGLNSSLNKIDHKEISDSITNTITKIIKDQIGKVIKNIDSEIVSNNKLEKIVNIVIENKYFNELISDIITDFLAGKKIESNNIGSIISKILENVSSKLNNDIVNIVKKFTLDEKLINELVTDLIEFLSLEKTNEEDKEFLGKLIKEIINYLAETSYFKTKIIKRTTDFLVSYSKEFDITKPFQWIVDFSEKIKSGFTNSDLNILGELIGDSKPINSENLIKIINLVFEKSNFENSILYKMLRNINMNPEISKRTNMDTLNAQTKISNIFNRNGNSKPDQTDPNNITPGLDILKLADDIFRMLHNEYKKVEELNFKEKIETNEWKAVYRLKVAIDFIIFEIFGRETLTDKREDVKWWQFNKLSLYTGTRAILWEVQEGTNIRAIPFLSSKFSGMQAYFKKQDDRRQFTNYAISNKGGWKYFEEDNYGPESITYIITSSGYSHEEKDKLKPINFQVDEQNKEKISKKEYVLLTLKEGGYAKFMKLNKRKSKSTWSGLDKIEFDKW
ncbi:hypothetical protein [Metamycoplasma alkalescens]|uniref:hypothetical protein n=1 Tax=Metamycoplasma alkalescens TaxID=45363 RepID=UPI003D0525E4